MSQLTVADTLIFAVIGISVLISFLRGFVREAISLVVWALAILLGFKYAGPLGNEWLKSIHSPELRYIIAFIALFLCIMVVGMVISAVMRALMDKTGLSLIDRLLGLIFGFARGVLVVAMVIMFIGMSSWQDAPWVKNSFAVEKLKPLVSWLSGYVPKQVGVVSDWVGHEKTSD